MGEKNRIGVNTLFMVPGDVGGSETYLRKTLQAIAIDFPEIRLVLFTSLDNDTVLRNDFEEFSQVEFVQLKFRASLRPLRIVAEQILLPYAARKADVRVLWSPGYTAPFWSPCRQVVSILDLQYKSHPDDMSFLERWMLDTLVKMACSRCNKVITISEFSRQEVLRYGFASPLNVHPVFLGVDESFSKTVKSEEITGSAVSALQKNRPYILCVAHTYPHKNVHLLIEAYSRVQLDIPHDLILVGKARRGEDLVKTSLGKVKDETRIHRFNGLDFLSLKYLYQNADLFVLPSAYEGFGLPVLEAMMAGTLVVTTQKASIPEIGGDYVSYCDPLNAESLADSLVDTIRLGDEDKRKILDAAKLRAKLFTWQKTAQETMNILQDTAGFK